MKIKMYPKSPAPRHVQQAVDVLKEGGVIIIPTDSVYAFACMSTHPNAIKRMAEIKGISVEKANFSFVFSDLSMLGDYARLVSNDAFKLMKRLLPGPFTFILNAGQAVTKMIPSKKTIGIRLPDNKIPVELVRELGVPILTTSVYDDDSILEYTTDPDVIADKYEKIVDLVIDGGFGHNEPSTVLDCSGSEVVLIRQGIGEIEEFV
ncbi:MAG: threonylcarbamoyl-AMP synthase [Candidatus Competibacteraceae bacterium]|nr:threonylcarbamoyl-AMP synthase [Candidatus Competibacteraceae bacterium]